MIPGQICSRIPRRYRQRHVLNARRSTDLAIGLRGRGPTGVSCERSTCSNCHCISRVPADAAVDGPPRGLLTQCKQIVSSAGRTCRTVADLKRSYLREPSLSSLRGKQTGTISQREEGIDHGLHSPYNRYWQQLQATLASYRIPGQRRPSDGKQNISPMPQPAPSQAPTLTLHRKVLHESGCMNSGKSSGHCRA